MNESIALNNVVFFFFFATVTSEFKPNETNYLFIQFNNNLFDQYQFDSIKNHQHDNISGETVCFPSDTYTHTHTEYLKAWKNY